MRCDHWTMSCPVGLVPRERFVSVESENHSIQSSSFRPSVQHKFLSSSANHEGLNTFPIRTQLLLHVVLRSSFFASRHRCPAAANSAQCHRQGFARRLRCGTQCDSTPDPASSLCAACRIPADGRRTVGVDNEFVLAAALCKAF